MPLLCSANAEFRSGFVEADFVEVAEELVLLLLDVEEELDEEELDDDDEPEELVDVGVGFVGVKRLFPAPNPILGA